MANKTLKIDLHIHTDISDGTDTPKELLDALSLAGITVFSVTDHDAVKAATVVPTLLHDEKMRFIPGVEFSCKDEEGKYHILGYGYDPCHAAIRSVVERGHALRIKKVRARLEFLQTTFGFSFPEDEIKRLLALDNPGKPHIGNMMVRYGYAESKEAAIRDYIDKIHFRSEYVKPQEAIEGILAAGGVPVLAHPFYGSGNELILGDEMETRLRRLIGFGLQGVEAFYSGFSDKLRAQMLSLADRFDLYVTAGSDYHGQNKLVKLGDTGLDAVTEYPEKLLRFLKRLSIIP